MGLQETRLKGNQELPDKDWHMWHASCTSAGQYGVAIWVHRHRPFLWLDGRPLKVEAPQVTVLHAEPRLLGLDVSLPTFRCVLASAHAPHTPVSGDTEAAEAFWRVLQQVLRRAPGHVPVILMVDANGRLGDIQSSSVGNCDQEGETAAGGVFHSFLQDHDLCAANTFSHCHSGSSHTWISSQGQGRRIDYIGLPTQWLHGVCTRVVHGLELLQSRDDHLPVLATCRVVKTVGVASCAAAPRRVAMRPSQDWTTTQLMTFHHSLCSAPMPAWDADVEDHYATWVQQHQFAWQAVPHVRAERPRQLYLSCETLDLVKLRQSCRRYVYDEGREHRRRLLLVGFAAFVRLRKGTAFSTDQQDIIQGWFWELDWSLARAIHLLQISGGTVRGALKRDRLAYPASLQARVAQQDLCNPRELFAALRRAFPQARSSRQCGFRPLPQVQLRDGSFAQDQAERTARWGEFFAEQEAGNPVHGDQYVAELAGQKRLAIQRRDGQAVFDWDVVPTLGEVETLMLTARSRKAVGHDGIATEALKLHLPASARRLFPLLVKLTVALHEPVAFRGGSLMALAKKAGASFACEDYRSILLACSAGKMYHKFLRNRLVRLLQRHRSELQCGATPGCGVEALSLVARSFQDQWEAAGRVWSLTFLDICAAFYRVVRQLVVQVPDTDQGILRIVSTLGLPEAALIELRDRLQAVAALPAAGASEHLAELVSDALQDIYRSGTGW